MTLGLLPCLRSTSCALLIASEWEMERWESWRGNPPPYYSTQLCSKQKEFTLWTYCFPTGELAGNVSSCQSGSHWNCERLLNKQTLQGVWTSEAGRGHGCCGHRMVTIRRRCKQSDTHWTFLLPKFPPPPPIVWEIWLYVKRRNMWVRAQSCQCLIDPDFVWICVCNITHLFHLFQGLRVTTVKIMWMTVLVTSVWMEENV